MSAITHDPQAVLDYAIDWTSWLAAGETITTAAWTVVGATEATPAASHDGKVCTIWLTGRIPGQTVAATVHITTSQGRQDDRTRKLYVADR